MMCAEMAKEGQHFNATTHGHISIHVILYAQIFEYLCHVYNIHVRLVEYETAWKRFNADRSLFHPLSNGTPVPKLLDIIIWLIM